MNNLFIADNLFSDAHPDTEGTYLWKNNLDVRVIKVYLVPTKEEYGLELASYLAVEGMRGRSVNHLQGSFVKITLGEENG